MSKVSYQLPPGTSRFKVVARKGKAMTLDFYDNAPIHGRKEKVRVDIKAGRNGKTIVLLPILGGDNTVANYFAKYFNFMRYSTVIIHRPDRPGPKSTDFQDQLHNNVMNCLQVFQWLAKEQRHIDYKDSKTALIGVSLGAINAANLTSLTNLGAYVLIMGGANISDIINHSIEFKAWIIDNIVRKGKSKFTFINELKRDVVTDPLFLAGKGRRTRMVVSALNDKSVPLKNQLQLRDAFNHKPNMRYVPVSHYKMLWAIPWLFPSVHWFVSRRT